MKGKRREGFVYRIPLGLWKGLGRQKLNWFLGEQDSLLDRGSSLCGRPEAEGKGVSQKDPEMVNMKKIAWGHGQMLQNTVARILSSKQQEPAEGLA